MVSLQVELDDEQARRLQEWAAALGCSIGDLINALVAGGPDRQELAVHLFQARCISMGRAAELASMSVAAFLERLTQLGVPVLDDGDDDDL